MGKKALIVIFLFIGMISVCKSEQDISWKTIEEDVRKLSRTSFYEKYKDNLKLTSVKEQGRVYKSKDIIEDLGKVEETLYFKGYSQWKKIKDIKEEFISLFESSSGAYSVLKKRIYDINLNIYKDLKILKDIRDQVNDELSVISKKIDKHYKEKNSIPSKAEMVVAIGSLAKLSTSHKVDKRKEDKSNFLIFSFYGLCLLIIGCSVFFLSKKKLSIEKDRMNTEMREKLIKGAGLNRTGVVTVNAHGEVESFNLRAREMLEESVGLGDIWDDFFQEKFYRGKKHLGVRGFYRFSLNSNIVFYINGHMDKVSQVRTIEIFRMKLKEFDNALSLLERSSIRVDSMELIDSVFSELINLNKISLTLETFSKIHFFKGADFLYLSEFEGKNYITQVFKIIDSFLCLKESSELIGVDIERVGADFLLKVNIGNCHLNENDLSHKVLYNRLNMKLDDVLKSFQNISPSYKSSLIVKNIMMKGERRVELKFRIEDSSSYETVHRVKKIGRETNV